jgi:glycosyltransferase involved in cell wall biosynthesis
MSTQGEPAVNTGQAVSDRRPAVSVILPTYNRARFLSQAFESIKGQSFQDWELIVVDDGSTDSTRELVAQLKEGLPQPVLYVYQENQGAYGARNTGLDLAVGKYVAFFDSDDYWLPHHLLDCVRALEANPEVDWVYGACRVVDFATGKVLGPNTFYFPDGRSRPFLKLRTRPSGQLQILEDPHTLKGMVTHGLYSGLQNSVIRRSVFQGRRFATRYRNEAEDLLIVIRALAGGHRLGYLNNVHVIYQIHEQNSSAVGLGASLDKRLQIYRALLRGFEEIRGEVQLTRAESRALDRSLGRVYFWELGYTLLWQNGRHQEALEAFRAALRLWPWSFGCWKTYLLASLKVKLGFGLGSGKQPLRYSP